MHLKRLEIAGFKSFAKRAVFEFGAPISAVVGPNGSGKSNVVEAIRFVLGEQSLKSMRGKKGEDLVFNGSQSVPKANIARVHIIFDNKGRELDIDFDDVEVVREVYRDGTNKYYINGSQVRLRDVYELLAKVHIGASGHHIISQGEADKVLNASPKERKVILEDALGLKIYQWKITESQKKLEKTNENIKEAQSLRREIAPHLKFLKKQVEKIEQAQQMRRDLVELYLDYLRREEIYLTETRIAIDEKKRPLTNELAHIERILEQHAPTRTDREDAEGRRLEQEIGGVRAQIKEIRQKHSELTRTSGRLEGLIEYHQSQESRENTESGEAVERYKVDALVSDLEAELQKAQEDKAPHTLAAIFESITNTLRDFKEHIAQEGESAQKEAAESKIAELQAEYGKLRSEITNCEEKEQELQGKEQTLQTELEVHRRREQESEREVYELRTKQNEIRARLREIEHEEEALDRDERDFREEIEEGVVLVGEEIRRFSEHEVSVEEVKHETRSAQEERRKHIERIKIRIEDAGGGSGEEVVREYEEVSERDQFLAQELLDLEQSAASLSALIEELTEKIDAEFKEGLKKINQQFQEFFALMFGGGSASLTVTQQQKRKKRQLTDIDMDEAPEDEEEVEEGVEVKVSLPHKKVKGLVMLSGGERALTSIALLFAMSQVNPPPFLVLDETDAALDEANARKYGDMLESLSQYSQLIVITHNRETMSRAGILYGVTMGSGAVSKTLSVKFDEASTFAK